MQKYNDKDAIMEKESIIIRELAKRGEQHDVMDALRLLTNAYIEMCGISLACRTVVFCAAGEWQERLAWMDLPLSEIARKSGLTDFLPYITSDYDPEIYNRYDIAGMDREELLTCCEQIVNENDFDEPTTEVLCWGILKATEEKEEMSREIEAISQDGTTLKGDLVTQHCGYTSLYITSPYSIHVIKDELVREPKELLIEAYNDIHTVSRMKKDVLALYPKYQEELKNCKNGKIWEKRKVFDKIYSTLISQTVISSLSLAELFNEWWGLDFFIPQYRE
jgi:hypothetical protein